MRTSLLPSLPLHRLFHRSLFVREPDIFFGRYPSCRKCRFYIPPNSQSFQPAKCKVVYKTVIPLEYETTATARTDPQKCSPYGVFYRERTDL